VKLLTDNVLAMLQRSRKGKYTVCIATQNPKLDNIGQLDLASVTSRICLHCEKPVYSRTILDCDDGFYLEDPRELLLRTPQFRGLQKLKGSLITPEEIPSVINEVRAKYGNYADFGFTLDRTKLIEGCTQPSDVVFTTATVVNEKDAAEKLFAEVLMWTLGRNLVSGNLIDTTFETGERDGRRIIDKLNQIGIVGEQVSTKRRTVLPSNIEDLTEDAISFLEQHGYLTDDIVSAFNSRV
jgi:DNA segregation ATPase FtsK/SpoIIIE-like protein